ncbi:MAG: DegV family protein [Clostridia bacterium]|nr:DegV family protein [Clostridia bacterium]
MNKYVIVTDTACDLEKSFREEFSIEYVQMHYALDGQDYLASLDWNPISAPDFYDLMRNGKRFITAQVNIEQYKEAFKEYIEEGYDVLYIACSSRISASINASLMARKEILEEYPNAKIICVDSLRACYALGLLVIRAAELRGEGKTIEEVAEWVEQNRQTVHMIGSVDKLTWLKQAGRVSATSAFFGGLLNIKPIIIADAQGRNFAIEKLKGRKNSFNRIVEMAKEEFVDVPYQRVFISHADCLEEAEQLKKMLLEALGKDIPVHIGYVGPGVGASVGPGMIGVYFYGNEVTVNKEE